jgi:hypothetical protein
MALKNIFKLTKRRQGELVGQIFKTIYCYTEFFVSRPRVYLKEVAQQLDTIYWLENLKTGEVTSMAILEPKYIFSISDITLHTFGHTISKVPNQIQNILDHILGDYDKTSLMFFSRSLFADAMQLQEKYNFLSFTPAQLQEIWPELSNQQTDYFNLSTGESINAGCTRKNYNIYLRLHDNDLDFLAKNNPSLYEKLQSFMTIEAQTESQ